MLFEKVALVTGGCGDLGNAMALHLGRAGAHVVVWDLKTDDEAVEDVRCFLDEEGGAIMYQRVDVSDRTQVESALDDIMAQLGRLDIACVNAGIVEAQPFLEITQENWQKHLDVNLTGAFNTAQSVARKMVDSKTEGRIIFTSSWVGAIPWPEITPYTVSKAGLNMLMKQMARELAPYGVRVNAVAPGIVKAGLAGKQLETEPQYAARVARVIPLSEPGTPEEVAEAVVYLASPQAAYITGTVLTIDGGCSLFQFDKA
ncbi:MAG: SDR family oxidoreductase [Chloroflexi bacterium]|nr:SDR family oxidoreductase [Chloroflexota bacterium]